MANYFDQFDTTTAPASKQNFFDQFDAPKRAPRSAEAVKAEYDALPWYGQAARAADDIVRSVANGMTFGFADKLAGAINGTGTETERSKSQEALDRAGSAGAVAEIGGAVATPVLAARNGLALAGRFGTDAMGSLTGLGARSGRYGGRRRGIWRSRRRRSRSRHQDRCGDGCIAWGCGQRRSRRYCEWGQRCCWPLQRAAEYSFAGSASAIEHRRLITRSDNCWCRVHAAGRRSYSLAVSSSRSQTWGMTRRFSPARRPSCVGLTIFAGVTFP